MESIYTSYKCKSCNKEIVLLTDEIHNTLKQDKYLACSHCGSRNLVKELVTDDLREVAKARSYKRVSGRLRQR